MLHKALPKEFGSTYGNKYVFVSAFMEK